MIVIYSSRSIIIPCQIRLSKTKQNPNKHKKKLAEHQQNTIKQKSYIREKVILSRSKRLNQHKNIHIEIIFLQFLTITRKIQMVLYFTRKLLIRQREYKKRNLVISLFSKSQFFIPNCHCEWNQTVSQWNTRRRWKLRIRKKKRKACSFFSKLLKVYHHSVW